MPYALERLGAVVEVTSLPVGDYAVGRDCVVERKTVPDLHGSILGGRFWPQLGALRASCRLPHLLVEGARIDRGPLHPNAVRGACLTATELGIVLLRSEGRDDSARWLHRLAVRCQRVGSGPDRPAYAQRPKPADPRLAAEAALAAAPGISVVCARALLARFGSVVAVLEASDEQLVTVPGIGPERVRALRDTFQSMSSGADATMARTRSPASAALRPQPSR